MRYAIISDIHGNLEAFESVLKSISREGIDRYLFVGDVVGYGADPAVCIEMLMSLACDTLIAGNHEWGVLGLLGLDYFNDYAKEAVIWTNGRLKPAESDYLESFKIKAQSAAFELVHGSLEAPAEFNYIFNSNDAYLTSKFMKKRICFIGHTHVAGIFCISKNEVKFIKNSVRLEPHTRYIVNAGSIGQPRDGDPRASYAIYDAEKKEIEIKRVDYNIKAARQKIIDAGLPRFLAERLEKGI